MLREENLSHRAATDDANQAIIAQDSIDFRPVIRIALVTKTHRAISQRTLPICVFDVL
jgi:hypothetical protein